MRIPLNRQLAVWSGSSTACNDGLSRLCDGGATCVSSRGAIPHFPTALALLGGSLLISYQKPSYAREVSFAAY